MDLWLSNILFDFYLSHDVRPMTFIFAFLLLTLFALQVKHLVIDFFWQPPFEWKNKGTYLHLGGVIHAAKHALGTMAVLSLFFGMFGLVSFMAIYLLALFDLVVHYHIDWAKMNFNARFGLTAQDEKFWWLLGLDQFLHQITYLVIVFVVVLAV